MFNNSIVTKSSPIYKFLIELRITLYLTTPQIHHLILFVNSMVTKGYCGKISDVSDSMPVRHRTSIGKFLSESPWNGDFVERALKKHVIKRIWETSKTTGKPIYIVIDDTISEKTVPSSKAKKPTEKCGFHNSHLKGKTVYGHERLGIKLNRMSKILTTDDVNLVKVGNNEYFVYTYRGKLNDAKNSLIALCWPKEALFKDGCLRAFITLDTEITTEELLNHYKHRWPIETFFRETKKYLGLNHYQVRSNRSINRYLLLLMMTYVYCELEVSNNTLKFSVGLKNARNQAKKDQVSWVFNQTSNGISLETIFETLKIA